MWYFLLSGGLDGPTGYLAFSPTLLMTSSVLGSMLMWCPSTQRAKHKQEEVIMSLKITPGLRPTDASRVA